MAFPIDTAATTLNAQRCDHIENYFRCIDSQEPRLPSLFTEDVEV
jgi:hypothetical protein